MVTSAHEASHSIFRHFSDLCPEVLERVFGVALGKGGSVTALDTSLTESRPLERRADSVLLAELLVEDEAGKYIVVVEAQSRPDEDKWWSWPYYIAYLREKYKRPVILLVVCNNPATEQWARTEISSGVGDLVCMRVRPAVAGPGNVEVITDLDRAREHVGFAVFSALTHSRMESAHEILAVLAEALGSVEANNGAFLSELVEAGLAGTGSYEIWRGLMIVGNFPHVSQWRAEATEQGIEQGIEQGSVRTRKEVIFEVLAERGIAVPDEDRAVIEACTALHVLKTWHRRAFSIEDIKDLFAE